MKDKTHNVLLISSDNQLTEQLNEYQDYGRYNFIGSINEPKELEERIEYENVDLVLIDAEINIDLMEIKDLIELYDIPSILIIEDLYDERVEKLLTYSYLIKDIDKNELKRAIAIAIKTDRENKEKIKEAKHRIQRKNKELLIEKTSSIVLLSACMILIISSIISRDATWLQYLLLVPSLTMFGLAFISLKKQDKAKPFDENPFVSIIIPAHNEEKTIENTIRSISSMKYNDKNGKKGFEIIVANDGSSDSTGEILSKLKNEIDELHVISRKAPRSGKGKGFVLNDALNLSKGEIIGVFDADTQVNEDFLERIIPYLNDEKVDGVQSRVKMYNKNHNFLTRMQHAEFACFANTLIAKDNLGKTGFLGGNGQFVKKEAILNCGGWDGFAVTEDLNLSVKIMLNGGHIRYCKEASVYQEAIGEWKPFFRQRTRWAIGNFETLFIYVLDILKSKLSLRRKYGIIEHISFYGFNLLIFFGFVAFILNMIAWILSIPTIIHMDAPWFVGLITIIAFFPTIMIALARDNVSIGSYVLDIIRYWAYCFHLIPLFFKTMFSMIARKERKWAKTEHKGEIEVKIKNSELLS